MTTARNHPRITAADARAAVTLTVNGTPERLDVEPRRSLADVLRRDLGLAGTQLGCDQGTCGSCTLLVDGAAVRSCLMLCVEADESRIETVEGLADDDGPLSELQTAFSEHHALQCGFCTAGFLMIATALLRDGLPLARDEVRALLAANLCRCTGYTPIVEAVASVADRHGLLIGDPS